jgi:hypothetical protein
MFVDNIAFASDVRVEWSMTLQSRDIQLAQALFQAIGFGGALYGLHVAKRIQLRR